MDVSLGYYSSAAFISTIGACTVPGKGPSSKSHVAKQGLGKIVDRLK